MPARFDPLSFDEIPDALRDEENRDAKLPDLDANEEPTETKEVR